MKMSNYKSLTLDELCEKIICVKNPVIIMHRSPDGDAVGSAMALWHLFSLLGKEAAFVCADKIPERLKFLTVGCTNKEFSDFSECDFISVDVASPAQLGNLPQKIPQAASPVLMIDHHSSGTPFADNYIRDDACATGEIIFDIAARLKELGHIGEFTPNMINALYAAISSDSGCFKYSNVTPHTHIVAAMLLDMGADSAEMNRLLFDSKSEGVLKAEGFALNKMHSYFSGKLNLVCITKADRDALGLELEFFETAIDVVRSLDGVEIAVAIKELDDGSFKVSLRSNCADVSALCAKFGGGGHVKAAGCTVKASSCDEAAELVLAEAKKMFF